MHDMIFRSLSRAKMIFFNNNPSGRVLNRFSRDMSNVDTLLPNISIEVLQRAMIYLVIIVINGFVNPWLLIPALIMTALYYCLRRIYIGTGRCLKRNEALSKFNFL